MRASVSEVMTEQTLGRGMRLAFGKYTDGELLDTVEVLAHEKYEELLKKREVLNQSFIDYGTYADVRRLADGTEVVRQKTVETDAPVVLPPTALTSPGGEDQPTPTSTDNHTTVGVVDVARGLAVLTAVDGVHG